MTIFLEITGPYPKEGFEDKDGTEHFNDIVSSPFGEVGNIKTHFEDGELVIDQASDVALFSSKPVEQWVNRDGVTAYRNPLGFRVIEIEGRNGVIGYLLQEEKVEWADKPGEDTGQLIGTLLISRWTAEGPPPPLLKHVETTKRLQEPT
jgi:hypothetical protein